MAGSIYGKLFTVTTWGESHGKGLGVVIDGCPAGIALSEEDIQIYLDRRKPGQNEFTTKRNESDKVSILSGVFEGKTTGTPPPMATPSLTASTILSIFICPGTISLYELTMPTRGFFISSSVKPNALNSDLCGAASSPFFTESLFK